MKSSATYMNDTLGVAADFTQKTPDYVVPKEELGVPNPDQPGTPKLPQIKLPPPMRNSRNGKSLLHDRSFLEELKNETSNLEPDMVKLGMKYSTIENSTGTFPVHEAKSVLGNSRRVEWTKE